MLGWGPATRIYLAAGATDMRKGFEGLYGLARDRLLCDPLSGHVFLFANAQRNRLKLLFWDGSGLWVCTTGTVSGAQRFSHSENGTAGWQRGTATSPEGFCSPPVPSALAGSAVGFTGLSILPHLSGLLLLFLPSGHNGMSRRLTTFLWCPVRSRGPPPQPAHLGHVHHPYNRDLDLLSHW
jgi:transposase